MRSPAVPRLLVLSGPTASGKSSLAMELSAHAPVTLISADSRQIYRGFDIGTAKPSLAERARVPHRMIDVADPTECITAAQWAEGAKIAIEESWAEGRQPIVVGGTGFWIRALLGDTPLAPVPPDPGERERLMALPDLHARLAEVDPASAAKLHPNDRFRLARALEIALATGRPRTEVKVTRPRWQVLHLTLVPDRDKLRQAIQTRTHAMNAMGWEQEVRQLLALHGDDLPLLDTLGYREWREVIRNGRKQEEAMASIVVRTWQYARRQSSWFRHEHAARPWPVVTEASPSHAAARIWEAWQAWQTP
ncbi:MAG: tRNA (adenosine(37)-N6)-dimethylallyltransferase MiaA [Candidatus Sericytochromatia bacterium]|nr:tRNA (adenosine(37)-N6)-dimethylallyltransferase MiaA [Candidatus Sericytochromatia bacterium]